MTQPDERPGRSETHDDAAKQLSRHLERVATDAPHLQPTRAECLDALLVAIALLDRIRPHGDDTIQQAWTVLKYLRAVLRETPGYDEDAASRL